MNLLYIQFVFVCVPCVHTNCVSASPRCFSTCPLRLNVRMRDSSVEKSRVFPSHTSIPIYGDFTKSEHPSNKQRYTRLPPPVFEGRYFEVALIFLWSSREQTKIKKRQIWTWVWEKEFRGGVEEEIRAFWMCETRVETRSGYTTQHDPIHFLSDTLGSRAISLFGLRNAKCKFSVQLLCVQYPNLQE